MDEEQRHISRRAFGQTTLKLGGIAAAAGAATLLSDATPTQAAGYGLNFWQFGQILLRPGGQVTYWFWHSFFDPYHWVRVDAVPEAMDGLTREAGVQIIAEWSTLVDRQGHHRLATFKNVGRGYLLFRPTIVIAPGR